jgi:PAC2 family
MCALRAPTNVPTLVVAFGGWVDAGEAATGAMRYLVRQLAGSPLASIDPEDFCDFTQLRPVVRLTAAGERTIRWPRIAFWTGQPPAGGAAPLSWRRAPAAVAHVRDPAPGRCRTLWGAAHRIAGRSPRGRAAYPASSRHGQQHRPRLARTISGVRDTDTSLALRRPDRH